MGWLRNLGVLLLVASASCGDFRPDDRGASKAVRELHSVEVASLRAEHVDQPPRDYERFLAATGEADEILLSGWVFRGKPPLDVTPPIDWHSGAADDRSWALAVNAWRPVNALLLAHARTGAERYIAAALAFAENWIESNPRSGNEEFQWYDMAVGRRAYRLAYILDVVRRDSSVSSERIERLWGSLVEHLDYLADDENIAFQTNHGFFQIVGQLATASRFDWIEGMEANRDQAVDRLERVVAMQFTADGVHKEHSPAYHYRMLENWWAISQEASLVPGDWVGDKTRQLEDVLAWMIMPNNRLAMLGDTSRVEVSGARASGASSFLEYLMSDGARGSRPTEELAVFADAGLIVMRDWPVRGSDFGAASYLAEQCAFHSRTHKHADDLAIVWYDKGQEILVGTGSYGYHGRTKKGSALYERGFWYSDPNRVFLESTRAHNTVEIDGESYDRTRVPFGSAIVHAGDAGGALFSECRVAHTGGVEHVRIVVNQLHEWLLVVDVMGSSDEHAYRQWFHFAPALGVLRDEGANRLAISGLREPLNAVSLVGGPVWSEPEKGRHDPMRGWWSPVDGEMEPNYEAAMERHGAGTLAFATLFAFGDAPIPDLAHNHMSDDGRRVQLRWRQDDEVHSVVVERPPSGKTTVRHDRSDR